MQSQLKKPSSSEALLDFDNVEVYYGSVLAISKISFRVNEGEILTLIGANGAGKSTVLRAISGLVKVSSGDIRHGGASLRNLAPHEIVRKHRISQVPEGRGIFLNLTVEENLDLGAWVSPSPHTYQKDLAYVFELFPRLKERIKQNAGTLSGGEQQMLAIGRALMGHPPRRRWQSSSRGT